MIWFCRPLLIVFDVAAGWAKPPATPVTIGLAEFERDLIRVRTAEGRERAKARGVKLGRRPKLTLHQQREAIKRREAGEPVREIARSCNVHNSIISRLAA